LAEFENLREFGTLVDIITKLRAPDGCPWDRKQTHESLREYLLAETYEALAALDEGDRKKLCEELGDILLQILLHAGIGKDAGEFDIHDVIEGLARKLIYRHPHVFGEVTVKNAEEVAQNWEALKKKERAPDASILSSVPKQMPALSYAKDVQGRVARGGFDWPDVDGVMDKLVEEVNELRESPDAEKAGEFGDVLFTLVNVARRMGIDPETALRETNLKFTKRFNHMEKLARERGLDLGKMTLEQQDALWNEAKKAERLAK
jgi:tetrapyrrole methylase family protein / MazG family protein